MDWLKALLSVLQIGFALFQYFVGKDMAKKEAAQKIALKFNELEHEGQFVVRDILVKMGRSSWIPWDQIPVENVKDKLI